VTIEYARTGVRDETMEAAKQMQDPVEDGAVGLPEAADGDHEVLVRAT